LEMKKLGTYGTFTNFHSSKSWGTLRASVLGFLDSVVTAAELLPWGPPSVKRAHLDRRPTGDGSLAPPRQCLIEVSGFQHPKTDYVPLGLQVRPVGDEHLAGPEFDKSSKKFCFFRTLELCFAPGHLNIRIGF